MQAARKYTLKNLGPARHVIGWKIDRDRASRTLTISHPSYVSSILAEDNITSRQASPTTMMDTQELGRADENETVMDQRKNPYAKVLGSLHYLADSTRPDIAHAVGFLGRHAHNPTA
jgi:hypothetical protein